MVRPTFSLQTTITTFFFVCLFLSPTTPTTAAARFDCDELFTNVTIIRKNLKSWGQRLQEASKETIDADWKWVNNLTITNQRAKSEKSSDLADLRKSIWKLAHCTDCSGICSDEEKRLLDVYKIIGTSALPSISYKEVRK